MLPALDRSYELANGSRSAMLPVSPRSPLASSPVAAAAGTPTLLGPDGPSNTSMEPTPSSGPPLPDDQPPITVSDQNEQPRSLFVPAGTKDIAVTDSEQAPRTEAAVTETTGAVHKRPASELGALEGEKSVKVCCSLKSQCM
jgi:hypothetical protein